METSADLIEVIINNEMLRENLQNELRNAEIEATSFWGLDQSLDSRVQSETESTEILAYYDQNRYCFTADQLRSLLNHYKQRDDRSLSSNSERFEELVSSKQTSVSESVSSGITKSDLQIETAVDDSSIQEVHMKEPIPEESTKEVHMKEPIPEESTKEVHMKETVPEESMQEDNLIPESAAGESEQETKPTSYVKESNESVAGTIKETAEQGECRDEQKGQLFQPNDPDESSSSSDSKSLPSDCKDLSVTSTTSSSKSGSNSELALSTSKSLISSITVFSNEHIKRTCWALCTCYRNNTAPENIPEVSYQEESVDPNIDVAKYLNYDEPKETDFDEVITKLQDQMNHFTWEEFQRSTNLHALLKKVQKRAKLHNLVKLSERLIWKMKKEACKKKLEETKRWKNLLMLTKKEANERKETPLGKSLSQDIAQCQSQAEDNPIAEAHAKVKAEEDTSIAKVQAEEDTSIAKAHAQVQAEEGIPIAQEHSQMQAEVELPLAQAQTSEAQTDHYKDVLDINLDILPTNSLTLEEYNYYVINFCRYMSSEFNSFMSRFFRELSDHIDYVRPTWNDSCSGIDYAQSQAVEAITNSIIMKHFPNVSIPQEIIKGFVQILEASISLRWGDEESTSSKSEVVEILKRPKTQKLVPISDLKASMEKRNFAIVDEKVNESCDTLAGVEDIKEDQSPAESKKPPTDEPQRPPEDPQRRSRTESARRKNYSKVGLSAEFKPSAEFPTVEQIFKVGLPLERKSEESSPMEEDKSVSEQDPKSESPMEESTADVEQKLESSTESPTEEPMDDTEAPSTN